MFFSIPHVDLINQYRSIVSGIYDQGHRTILVKKTNCLKGIERFSERISKAKKLLLDIHISFENYLEIKNDLEEKIGILGNSFAGYSERHK